MAPQSMLDEMRTPVKSKVLPFNPRNLVTHTLPGMSIQSELSAVERLVLDLTAGNAVYNVYLGLITRNGRSSEIHLTHTHDVDEANRVYENISTLLESGKYELHLYPPNIAGLAEHLQ